MAKKKMKTKVSKRIKEKKPLKIKKMSAEDKKKVAGTVAAGVGAGIGFAIWYFLKKLLVCLAAMFLIIVLVKLLYMAVTGNPYPWGLGG